MISYYLKQEGESGSMGKTRRRGFALLFAGFLSLVLTWGGRSDKIYSLDWDHGNTVPDTLLFSSQDSLIWERIVMPKRGMTDNPINHQHIVTVFDKLMYYALLEKCRGNAKHAEPYFHRANLTAHYFDARFGNSSLLQALRFYDSLSHHELKVKLAAERFLYRGCDLYHQRKFAQAESAFIDCLKMYSTIQDDRRTFEATYQLAHVALAQLEYSKCRDLALLAVRQPVAEKWQGRIGWLHWLIGEAQCSLANYEEAKKEFVTALSLAESNKDSLLIARTYERLGVAFWRQGDLLNALDGVGRSRHLSHQLHNQHVELNCLILLGIINRGLGNYAKASQSYKEAYDLNHTVAQPHLNPLIATNWAFLYIELGDWENALDLQMRALYDEQAKPNPVSRYLITYYSNIGLIYANLQEFEKALEFQKLALQVLKKTDAPASDEALTHLRMADSYSAMRQRKEAESFYKTALAIAERTNETTSQVLCLLGLSNFYREGEELDLALSLQKQALNLAQSTRSADLEWNATFALGETYEALHEIDLAENAYKSALQKVEISRTKIAADTLRTSFFACKQDVYERLIHLRLNARNDPESALRYSEQSRARTMLDIMGERFSKTNVMCEIPRLTELQLMMTAQMVFIEYKLLSDGLVIWVVKKDSLAVETKAISRQMLVLLVQEFLQKIGVNDFEIFRKQYAENPRRLFDASSLLGVRLYDNLVAPIEKHLSPDDMVYIIPDDVLHYLPFAALTIPESNPPQFLLERYKIAYMPSLTVFNYLVRRRIEKPRRHLPQIFAVANPTGDLRNTEKEAQAVDDLFGTSSILIHSQASKKAVIDGLHSGANYFHFAGHCRINTKSPMHSALLLYANSTESPGFKKLDNDHTEEMNNDGMLSVQDLLNFSLDHIELVTLSACETALGKLFKGEGIMGFSHALLGSGIATLVSSLWKIDDRYSAELMQSFYRYLATGEYTKMDALRQAQLDKIVWCRADKIVKYPFPYFWAPYILNGMAQ